MSDLIENEAVEEATEQADATAVSDTEQVDNEQTTEAFVFTSGQVEEMGERLLLNDVVQHMFTLQKHVTEQFQVFVDHITALQQENGRMREELNTMADFLADAELALHQAQGFKPVAETVKPNLRYADVLNEFNLGAALTLNNSVPSSMPTRKEQQLLEKTTEPKEERPNAFKTGLKPINSTTRQDRMADDAKRMYQLFG